MAAEPVITVEVSLARRECGGGMLHFRVNGEIVASCVVAEDQMPLIESRQVRIQRKPRSAPERK